MKRNEITYGSGPHPEIWFPVSGPAPDLQEAEIRYMVLRADEADDTIQIWSNATMSRFIPDFGSNEYWIGVKAKDKKTLNIMEDHTSLDLNPVKLSRSIALENNAQTPQPVRPGATPDLTPEPSFIDEIAKITPKALLADRAKIDYADHEDRLKKIVRLTAEGGGIAVTLFLVELPTEEIYRRAFCEAMVEGAFRGFSVDAKKLDEEGAPRLMLEIHW